MNFVVELKRRNVFKVAAAYAAVAWMFLELSALTLNAFSAPAWVMKVLIYLVIAGFAVAVLLAWAFELTPEGIKRTSDSGDTAALPVAHSGKLMPITVLALALTLVLVVVDAYVLRDTPAEAETALADAIAAVAGGDTPVVAAETAAPADEKSLVVLPFANLSDDPDQEYFSDGMTEELINTLSRVDDLLVTGRTSAFFYKNSALPLMEIGAALNVNHVLQGSVRKSGTQLRIAVTLTETASGFNLWTDTYDRELDDIFALQDEIAAAVTEALSITLGAGAFAEEGMTRNVEAYDQYLQARVAETAYSAENVQQAIRYAERAVALDPNFALGWFALGNLYRGGFIMMPRTETDGYLDKSAAALNTAIALAPDSAAGLSARADQARDRGDWVAAEQLLQQRLAVYGETPEALDTYAEFLSVVGRSQEALRYSRRLERVDPEGIAGRLGQTLLAADAPLSEIRAWYDAMPEESRNAAYFAHLSLVLMLEQDWDAALAATARTESVKNVQTPLLSLAKAGRFDEGLAAIREQMRDPNLQLVLSGKHLPWMAIAFGDDALAAEILLSHSLFGADFTHWTDHWSKARTLAAFKQHLQRVGLVDYWRTTGNWADKCRPVNDDFECF